MIRFEEHEGQLFRMLEEPVPLTPDAEMPCLVRLIQDDSPMGLYNKNHRDTFRGIKLNCFLLPIVAIFIDNNNIVNAQSWEYYRYEILGYPVAEGSRWWALYQMMQGKKVSYKSAFESVYLALNQDGDVQYYDMDNHAYISPIWSKLEFGKNHAVETGWQIYKEPKPLLADARKGDLCQRSNGRYTQFHSKHKLNDGTIAYYFDDVSGSTNIDGDHCPHECGNNIVSCEPLAPIGSAEWALQMMKLGKDVCRKGQETAYYHICNGGKEIACSLKNERRLTCGHLLVSKWGETGNDWQLYEPKEEPPKEPDYVICKRCGGSKSIANPAVSNTSYTTCPKCGGTGYEIKEQKPESAKEPIADCDNCKHACTKSNIDHCQMYEPKPTFKVGDWVECNGNQRLIDVIGRDLGRGNYYHFAHGFGGAYANSITRKLSPSEIVIKIGCLEGRVEDLSYADNGRFFLVGKATERHPIGMYSILYEEMLDAPTRELVESLLKAQIKENA